MRACCTSSSNPSNLSRPNPPPQIRPLDDQVDDDPTGIAIEKVTSKYGLHSKVYNSPWFKKELEDQFNVSFEIHTNIQMDLNQKRMIDFAEWTLGEHTEAAQRLGLPKGAFMDERGWEAVVETYRGEILKHEASLRAEREEKEVEESSHDGNATGRTRKKGKEREGEVGAVGGNGRSAIGDWRLAIGDWRCLCRAM